MGRALPRERSRSGEESQLNSANRLSFSRSIATCIGTMLCPVQFHGKWKLTGVLGVLLNRFTPEADCHPVRGARLGVSLGDRIGCLMWTGCYEVELVTFLRSMLEPGMVFVDVGANIGYFSIIGAALVGERGAVHSFEADPDCLSRLAGNARDYPWVATYPTAVADYTGEIAFYRSPKKGESGWGTVFEDASARDKVVVPVCTLDRWSADQSVNKIGLLKMDVEGAEYRVLQGGRATLRATRPIIWMEANEYWLRRDGKSAADLLSLLAEWDYLSLGLTDPSSKSLTNIVAVPKEQGWLLEKVMRLNLGLQRVKTAGASVGAVP